MKKIYVLLFLLLFLTGCDAEYNLTYKNDIMTESLIVSGNELEEIGEISFKDSINDFINNNYLLVNYNVQPGNLTKEEVQKQFPFYNSKILKEDNDYKLKLDYTYDKKSEINNSAIINVMYNKFNYNNEYITANGIKNIYNYYPYLDKITVTFKTDKTVLKSNCDEEKDKTYYWYVNRENYQNKKINITLASEENEETIIDGNQLSGNVIKYLLLIILLIITIVTLIIYEKIKKSND